MGMGTMVVRLVLRGVEWAKSSVKRWLYVSKVSGAAKHSMIVCLCLLLL